MITCSLYFYQFSNCNYIAGLMNTISAIFIVYLGVHAGKILLMYYQYNGRVIRWLLWAVLTVSSNMNFCQQVK